MLSLFEKILNFVIDKIRNLFKPILYLPLAASDSIYEEGFIL